MKDLAEMLGTSEFEMLRSVYRSHEYYARFRRRKSSGEHRVIHAPDEALKKVQKAIISEFLSQVPLPDSCTGFRPGKSILSNTTPHCGKRFVFNTDIEEFFATISSERVLGLFLRLGFSFPLACVLTEVTTYHGCLPQGAPSSPYIANLICYSLDSEMEEFCAMKDWSYTRYCDDITISGDSMFTLADMRTIEEIIDSEGFFLNMRKTRFLRKNSAQVVSGLVVNERPNLPRAKRRKIRAMFHQAELNPEQYKGRVKELENHLSMLTMLNPQSKEVSKYRIILNQLCAKA